MKLLLGTEHNKFNYRFGKCLIFVLDEYTTYGISYHPNGGSGYKHYNLYLTDLSSALSRSLGRDFKCMENAIEYIENLVDGLYSQLQIEEINISDIKEVDV